MRILIAPDKFKGSLTGRQAGEAIHRGFIKIFPNAHYQILPLADGGEGFLDAFLMRDGTSNKQSIHKADVQDALGREISASFLIQNNTAIIESSQANGLFRIGEKQRNLLLANSYGVGELIRSAISLGARKIIIGIGGSATNDAGLGLAAAIGYRFLDSYGKPIDPIPANIPKMCSIDSSEKIELPPIVVACDVNNPLLGPRGATYTYGPQKGLRSEQKEEMESSLARFSELVSMHLNNDFAAISGAGAAGGLGFGLMAFCNATLESGFDCIAESLDVETQISAADLVITAEGSLDSQTLEGKTPYGVSLLARKHNIPIYAIAGCIDDEHLLRPHFDGIASIMNAPMTLAHAMDHASELLEFASTRLAHTLKRYL
ncbi:MAG: glycerate kinase [Armatimonadetes bacterium]|nr:glycerate kinase [Akkermansiaceae bacterium]